MKRTNSKKGFTIIEVVLVLAIAGLIFLVVFLALPALQRGQRDNQRKSDLNKFMSQLTTYTSNNQGKVPTSSGDLTTFVSGYITNDSQQFADPQKGNYVINYQGTNVAAAAPAVGSINYFYEAKCDGQTAVANAGNSRSIAVEIGVEQGGTYCQNN